MEVWLRKTEKLSLVGQLAAGVAHEIRNPLTSIKGFMQLVKSTKECKDFYIDIILSELERTESIIYEFLSLAKPNEIKHMEKTNITEILVKVIQLLEAQAHLQGVTINTSFQEDYVIQCNKNEMKQVFLNLIQNAIEACHSNGCIQIQLKEKDLNHIIIQIQDDGCGIPRERLHKLGEPFYSTKEKGTGLGLLVTYKIIEGHKGKVNFTSEVGKGTTVEIVLPKRIYTLVGS
ncbi:GHKL domain-containing protein [Anaerobacillus sp. CMMVII]|uniref:ATP-binding protein n=1 Tax=Anaerobacillus sp. CMMVII TaxID=2755588 RepID=UPI0021B8053C|nr:ATP-binding protein [Anaerobacillus sp. CMMVII]MCT8137269.1 GHKL domain-containing protein [Anaerobacillus sp. CMMVII]